MDTNNWPEHHQELGRKTMETLHAWSDRYNRGVINARELYCIVSALYDATSGLMDKEFSRILADLHQELRKPVNPVALDNAA